MTWSPEQMGPALASDPKGPLIGNVWRELDEEDRDQLNVNRSTRRSAGAMRRYMIHNRLVKMWVLTFERSRQGADGYLDAMQEVARFIRRLRRSIFRDRDFPYLFALELHPGGHGWHVNLMLQSVFIDKRQLQRLWGHGNVWFTDFTKDSTDWLGRQTGRRAGRGGSNGRTAARVAASYAAKYIVKQMDADDRPERCHRYEVAQGFQPPVMVTRVPTFEAAVYTVRAHPSFGTAMFEWSSNDCDDWFGPPARVLWFDPPSTSRRPVKGLPSERSEWPSAASP